MAQDCIQNLFIYMWHQARTLPTDKALAMRILVAWARHRIINPKSRLNRWEREIREIPAALATHMTSPTPSDRHVLTRLEAIEYLTQATATLPTTPRWVGAIIGESTLDDMQVTGDATSTSDALRKRNRVLRALRTAAQSNQTTTRILVSRAVSDEDFRIIAYAHNRHAASIARHTGMAIRNVYTRMGRLGIPRHQAPRNVKREQSSVQTTPPA